MWPRRHVATLPHCCRLVILQTCNVSRVSVQYALGDTLQAGHNVARGQHKTPRTRGGPVNQDPVYLFFFRGSLVTYHYTIYPCSFSFSFFAGPSPFNLSSWGISLECHWLSSVLRLSISFVPPGQSTEDSLYGSVQMLSLGIASYLSCFVYPVRIFYVLAFFLGPFPHSLDNTSLWFLTRANAICNIPLCHTISHSTHFSDHFLSCVHLSILSAASMMIS